MRPDPKFRNEMISDCALEAIGFTTSTFATACGCSRQAMRYYRELVGDDVGGDLVGCEEFTRALHDHVANHLPEDEPDFDDDDYFNDQFTINKVGPGKVVFEGLLDGEEDIVISLPKSVTSKAKAGWSVTMEVARIKGKWRILGVGNVYP